MSFIKKKQFDKHIPYTQMGCKGTMIFRYTVFLLLGIIPIKVVKKQIT